MSVIIEDRTKYEDHLFNTLENGKLYKFISRGNTLYGVADICKSKYSSKLFVATGEGKHIFPLSVVENIYEMKEELIRVDNPKLIKEVK